MQYLKHGSALALLAVAAFAAAPSIAADKAAPKTSAQPATIAKAPAAPAAPAAAGQAAYGVKIGAFFNEEQKQAARRAFSQKYAKAKECLPGMEKSKKGCASPWDSRYWAVGQSLQPAITAYPVPEPVAAALPAPPKGYEYVRVADDILMIASGSKLVVDMIEHVAG